MALVFVVVSVTSYFFFFQAEDGIRDGHVTGVQTCALPILMKAMAVSEFIPFIQQEIADRMGVAKATAVASGTGINEPKGIITTLNETANAGQVVEYEDGISYKNLTSAASKIHSSLIGGVSIYANSTTI